MRRTSALLFFTAVLIIQTRGLSQGISARRGYQLHWAASKGNFSKPESPDFGLASPSILYFFVQIP